MTNREVLVLVQAKLLEPGGGDALSWPTGLWTFAEAFAALELRQQHFLDATGLLGGWREQALLPLQDEQTVPDDTIQAVWHGIAEHPDGTCTPLLASERASMDRLLAAWRQRPEWPRVFTWEETGLGRLTVAPAPQTGGRLHLFGPVLPESVDDGAGTEAPMTVPDEWMPYLVYGVLAVLLAKHGRGYDGPRAAYCEGRYQEGLEAAAALARGWADG